MADDQVVKYLDEDDFVRAPEPFNHIVASPVFSPVWGRGWLGYTVVGDQIDLWFVYGDRSGAKLLDYLNLMTYNDRQNSQLWMILVVAKSWDDGYHDEVRHQTLTFLLNPPEDSVVFRVPTGLTQALKDIERDHR